MIEQYMKYLQSQFPVRMTSVSYDGQLVVEFRNMDRSTYSDRREIFEKSLRLSKYFNVNVMRFDFVTESGLMIEYFVLNYYSGWKRHEQYMITDYYVNG